MIIVDANVLLYAYNADAPEQPAAARWLQRLMESGEPIGIPWVAIWAFVRIGTNSRVFANPRSARESFAIVSDWLSQPGVTPLNPGPQHAAIFERLVCGHKVMGPMVTDAALAAIAVEYGATLASTDQDFRRFAGLKYVNPLEASA